MNARTTKANILKKLLVTTCTTLMLSSSVFALPKAAEIYPYMGLGWNLGNTLEVPKDPTAWGNIVPNAQIIKGVKDAGFTTIRLPCAWNSHASNGTIDASWLATVKSVVDMAIANNMFVLLNSHWDEGWLEDHVFDGEGYDKTGLVKVSATEITAKQASYWKQIAEYFKDYDERLIFASANEPGVNDPWGPGANGGQWEFTNDRMKVLKSYHEACIKAVRESGGNNATRTIIVQMPRTEIDNYEMLANNYPADPAGDGYTMAEAHFYPYQFAFMENDENWGKVFYYWESETTGDANRTCSGGATGSKSSIDAQFSKLENAFVKKNIPVVIGEMGINKRYSRIGRSDFTLDTHLKAVAAWYGYTVKSAKAHGLVPCVWDTGYERQYEENTEKAGDGDMTIIRRQSKYGENLGEVIDVQTMNSLKTGFGETPEYTPAPAEATPAANPGAAESSSSEATNCIGGDASTNCVAPITSSSSSTLPGTDPQSSSSSAVIGQIDAIPNAQQSPKANFARQGNLLIAQGNRAEIRIFDMNGNLVRSTRATSDGSATLSLQGLKAGIYIARSNSGVLKVNLK